MKPEVIYTGQVTSPLTSPVCFQVIIIQPQAPSSTEGSPAPPTPTPKSPSTPKSTSLKKDEDPEVRRYSSSSSSLQSAVKSN